MRTADFDYHLPPELIAQAPAAHRDQSRLLLLDRQAECTSHHHFKDLLTFLRPGDVLVLNDSRVLPARLRGVKSDTGGQIEMLLVEENTTNDWWVMLRPGKRVRPGTEIQLRTLAGEPSSIYGTVREKNPEGHCRVQFSGVNNLSEALESLGETPLPPYINRGVGEVSSDDRARYQTVYAQPSGSVAAPTAGLHFTAALLEEIRCAGMKVCFLTLHVGLGTFVPVKAERLEEHIMHEERFSLNEATADTINSAKREGRRVIAVGTTTMRVLESVANQHAGELRAASGRTRIFLYPPCEFKIADALLTNFHLPQSTLLMLVCAFAAPRETRGRELILSAYAEAVRERYRFFSYGDAMFIQ